MKTSAALDLSKIDDAHESSDVSFSPTVCCLYTIFLIRSPFQSWITVVLSNHTFDVDHSESMKTVDIIMDNVNLKFRKDRLPEYFE